MEKIVIKCPHCGYQAKAKMDSVGKKTKCPECERVFIIAPQEETMKASEIEDDPIVLGTCPACGSDIELQKSRLGAEIECPRCREKIVIQEEKEYKCPFCGQNIKRGATVCRFCHKNLDELSIGLDRLKQFASSMFKKFRPHGGTKNGDGTAKNAESAVGNLESTAENAESTAANADNDAGSLQMCCPYCNAELVIDRGWIGQSVECPTCGKAFMVAEE